MLFDPLEEQFDLPATLVKLRDDKRGQKQMVGEKDEDLVGFGVVVANAPQGLGIGLGRIKAFQANGLIATQTRRLVDGKRAEAMKSKILAGAGDEVSPRLVERIEAGKIQVAAVHQVNATGFEKQFVENVNLVDFRGFDRNEGRNVALQIEQCMHLDSGILGAIARPGKQRQAQIDGSRVERVDGLLQLHPEVFVGVQEIGRASCRERV